MKNRNHFFLYLFTGSVFFSRTSCSHHHTLLYQHLTSRPPLPQQLNLTQPELSPAARCCRPSLLLHCCPYMLPSISFRQSLLSVAVIHCCHPSSKATPTQPLLSSLLPPIAATRHCCCTVAVVHRCCRSNRCHHYCFCCVSSCCLHLLLPS